MTYYCFMDSAKSTIEAVFDWRAYNYRLNIDYDFDNNLCFILKGEHQPNIVVFSNANTSRNIEGSQSNIPAFWLIRCIYRCLKPHLTIENLYLALETFFNSPNRIAFDTEADLYTNVSNILTPLNLNLKETK